jgi:hypothetical protein
MTKGNPFLNLLNLPKTLKITITNILFKKNCFLFFILLKLIKPIHYPTFINLNLYLE